MVRENKEKPDGGPVGKMLSKLGDSKDSGQRMMHKKTLEAAGGGGDAAAARKAEEKKPEKKEKKEKKGGDEKKEKKEKKGGGQSKKGADDDAREQDRTMNEDDAADVLADVVKDWAGVNKKLTEGDWQAKTDSWGKISEVECGDKLPKISAAMVVIANAKTGKFQKEKNFNVYKAIFVAVAAVANQSSEEGPKFSRAAAGVMIAAAVEKQADKKLHAVIRDMLGAFAEHISPKFVFKTMIKALAGSKAMIAHVEALAYLLVIVEEYGAKSIGEAAIGQFGVLQWERARTELKDVKIKNNLIALLSKTYSQIGPNFAKRCLKGMTDQMTSTMEAEFAKAGFDPAVAAGIGDDGLCSPGTSRGTSRACDCGYRGRPAGSCGAANELQAFGF